MTLSNAEDTLPGPLAEGGSMKSKTLRRENWLDLVVEKIGELRVMGEHGIRAGEVLGK